MWFSYSSEKRGGGEGGHQGGPQVPGLEFITAFPFNGRPALPCCTVVIEVFRDTPIGLIKLNPLEVSLLMER